MSYLIGENTYYHRTKVIMRWSDCDMLGHVNNAVYLTYAEQARTAYCSNLDWDWMEHGIILAKAELTFKKPLLYTDSPFVYTRVSRMGNKSFDIENVILDEKDGVMTHIATICCTLVMIHYKTGETFPIPPEIRAKIADFEHTTAVV
ncbi:MAG: acyl-CoA thioesterase [Bacteroidia bacterium]